MANIGKLLGGLIEKAKGIRAYHSSPHDFSRFDASKIGTGEGNQTYGYGHYLAENPAVSGRGGQYWDQFTQRFVTQPTPEGLATSTLKITKGDTAAAIEKLKDTNYQKFAQEFLRGSPYKNVDPRDAITLLESGKPVGPRTYEVDINARPEQFLDWDKPLSAQAPSVQGALRGVRSIIDRGADKIARTDRTGQYVYSQLGRNDSQASAVLREAGIPGVRYLDQGSRDVMDIRRNIEAARASGNKLWADALEHDLAGRGSPTSNYVVFPGNEHLIDIVKKYGLAAAAPVAGAAALAPGQAEASFLPIERKMPELPNQGMGDALGNLTAGDAENQAAADAMRPPLPPEPPPMPPRPASQFAAMPTSPATPPAWLTQILAPLPSNAYQPPPSMVPNRVGKLRDPNAVPPGVLDAAGNVANALSMLVGPW